MPRPRSAFTLIEVVVVMAMVGVILAGALTAFSSFRSSSDLSAAADLLKITLEKARLSTLSREDGSGYSVKISSANFVWFKGQTFNSQDPNNKTFNLPALIKIQSATLENLGDIVLFNSLTGTTSPGSIILAAGSDPAQTKTLYLNRSGFVSFSSEGAAVKPTVDTRHLHFNLGWSIQSASQLQLKFLVDPADTRNVAMAPYFNSDKTNWDYSGTFNVGGENQTLRIHTHTLNPSNTLLSIERNRMANSKPVEISIDSKTIVTYASDGAASAGPFGGQLIVP